MSSHELFEELCVLAAAGEISQADGRELMAHIEKCASCRKTLADMRDIHATWLPEREGFEIKRSFSAESNLRRLVLQRAAMEGAQFSSGAQLPTFPISHSVRPLRRGIPRRLQTAAAVVLAALAGAAVAKRTISHRSGSQPSTAVETPGIGTRHPSASSVDASEFVAMREDVRQAQEAREKLEASLKNVEAEKARLTEALGAAERRASTLEQSAAVSAQEVSNLQLQLDSARASESRTLEQLANLKSSASDEQTDLALVEGENKDLREKLAQQTAAVDREQELMADGREIRDLIAARNLHIIDVYDTSGQGRTQKSFGRVFYTEGKSLVFYAYDLPSRHPAAKYAFYAWGKKDVSGDVKVRNLGIFYNDDQAQKRWVLKITDPMVLSEIDSVFVTLEKTDDLSNTPTGKKLLSAYLGSPANHP